MIGLRIENDHLKTNNNYKKSYKFASNNYGKFYVSGISGSFQKYTKQKLETDKKYLKNEKNNKYTYEPVLEKYQKDELLNDAKRLIELEEKLNELQRIKECKRIRDRLRRKKRLEYQSICLIQRTYRNYKKKYYSKHISIIHQFIKVITYKQAISAAAWAIKVLRRFAIRASYMWKRLLITNELIPMISSYNWILIQDVVCLYTSARREKASNFVYHCIKSSIHNVIKNNLIKKSPKKKQIQPKKSKQVIKKQQQVSNNDHLQFFLTEFDGQDDNYHRQTTDDNIDNEDDEDDNILNNQLFNINRRSNKNKKNRLHNHSLEDMTESAQSLIRTKKYRKVYDENNEKHRKVIQLHQKRLKEIEDIRIKRSIISEQIRIQKEKDLLLKQQEEIEMKETEKVRKERMNQSIHNDRIKARNYRTMMELKANQLVLKEMNQKAQVLYEWAIQCKLGNIV